METRTLLRGAADYPTELTQMHESPQRLYVRGASLSALLSRPRVAIVGSRRMSPYGRQVTAQFASRLAEQGVVIISGLALGVDAVAHQSTIEAGGQTIAVLPCPVEDPVPRTNRALAQRILSSGGALVSSYAAGSDNHRNNFVARNEIVAALAHVLLITEATTHSGTWSTAEFAGPMRTAVMAVPGPVTSPQSAGTHRLIVHNLATLAPDVNSVLAALELRGEPARKPQGRGPEQQRLLELLADGVSEGYKLLEQSQLPVQRYSHALTMLEINGQVRPLGCDRWSLA